MLARSSRTTWTPLSRWIRYNSTRTPYVSSSSSHEAGPKPFGNGSVDTSPKIHENNDMDAPVVLSEADIASMIIPGRALYPPTTIPRTHGIPVAEIQFRSHHPYPLDLFTHVAGHTASALGIPATRPIPLPTQRSMWTVLRGPFIHKKSQENFERRVHKRVIKAWDADPVVVERWVRYLRKHQMPGVGIRVTTWERAPLGVGKQIFEQAMEKIRPGPEEIKALAEKIVEQELSAVSGGEQVPGEKSPIPGKS